MLAQTVVMLCGAAVRAKTLTGAFASVLVKEVDWRDFILIAGSAGADARLCLAKNMVVVDCFHDASSHWSHTFNS